jgi:hypothetical protein
VAPAEVASRWLHVAGSVDRATLIAREGTVQRGHHFEVGGGGGTLLIDHQPGPVLAWVGPADSPERGLWHGEELPDPRQVSLPAHLWLTGRSRAYSVTSEQPALLEVAVDGAAVLRLAVEDRETSWIEPAGGVRHLLVPAGEALIAVRPAGRAELEGELVLGVQPLTRVGEGLGAEHLLAPGSGHGFQFTVDRAGPVGVGVRADPDTVHCQLSDADGTLIGSGVVQKHDLEPGDYLLVVRVPAESEAVRARPAVVGLDRPSTDPPEDVIRGYLELERRSP